MKHTVVINIPMRMKLVPIPGITPKNFKGFKKVTLKSAILTNMFRTRILYSDSVGKELVSQGASYTSQAEQMDFYCIHDVGNLRIAMSIDGLIIIGAYVIHQLPLEKRLYPKGSITLEFETEE